MTSKVTKWLTRVSFTLRRAGAYYAMKLALWLDTEITIKLCLALTQENLRRQMEMQGNEVIRVTRREPTIH